MGNFEKIPYWKVEAYLEHADEDFLMHWGIKGMKWGVRRYQNPDGTLTEEGRRRYGKKLEKLQKEADKYNKLSKDMEYWENQARANGGKANGNSADDYRTVKERTKDLADRYQKKADKIDSTNKMEREKRAKEQEAREAEVWGTYFNTGLLSNINVLRCNRQLSYNGIYDEVENTGDGYTMRYEAPIYTNWLDKYSGSNVYGFAKESEIYIVYLIQYNIEQQVFGDDHISATALYATPLDEIRTAGNSGEKSVIKTATDIIGGIYGVTGKFGSTLDAQVVEAWILPTWFINIGSKSAGGSGDTLYHNFKSKSEHGDLTIKGYVVYPSKNLLEYRTIESDPNKVIYFGTINNGLKLKRYTYDNLHCFVYAYVGASTIQIIATQGEDQKDLTKDFTIMLTENSGVTTGIRAVAKALSRSISMGTSAYKDFAKGDYSSGGLGIVKGIADMVPLQPKIDKALGNGDASTIYYRRQSQASGDPKYNCVDNPFVSTIFTSVIDEKARVRLYGASFNELISNFSTIYTKDLLGTGTLEDTYIVANVRVDGIPTEAKTYIENTFKNGFYSQYLN